MHKNLPQNPTALINWTWPEIEPHFRELEAHPLTAANADEWLADWSRLGEHLDEMYARLAVATSVNTADKEAEKRLNNYLDTIFPAAMAAEQKLKEKLLASGLEPKNFEIPLRNMRTEAALFRQANLPLLAEQQKLGLEYDKMFSAQTAEWEGKEITLTQLKAVFEGPDRAKREKAWRLTAERQLADRKGINELWQKFVALRGKVAANADKPSFREYQWKRMLRFDYTPDDCKAFQKAIEEVVVPAAARIYERRGKQLGVDTLRPWDLVDGWYSRPTPPPGQPLLKPFDSIDELKTKVSAIFHKVDPGLGSYFDIMLKEGLTDLDNRKNKAPGAFCTLFSAIRRPFIFVNAVGIHEDVQTTLHESGHAFHDFEKANLPYIQQLTLPMEFAEVASMGMELLASPYLTKRDGGFYTEAEAARARIEHLERGILFWPFMAIVDAFQHWVYENPVEGANPGKCDVKWNELWDCFIPKVDWKGLEDAKITGWQRKLHIHQIPFYYVEYGLAQLGAVQVWGNALKDQAGAVAAYRKALALGGTVTLPELFTAAGARFAFDAATLKKAVDLMERVIGELETHIS
jgi:oligoendopeptidase F